MGALHLQRMWHTGASSGHAWSMPMWCGIPILQEIVPCLMQSNIVLQDGLWEPLGSETLKWTKSSNDWVSDLNWPSLSTKRIFLTCLFLFNVMYEQVISKLKDHLLPQSDITISHKLSFQTISSTINSYRYSLLVNVTFLWNNIPSHVLEAGNTISKFKQVLHRWLL